MAWICGSDGKTSNAYISFRVKTIVRHLLGRLKIRRKICLRDVSYEDGRRMELAQGHVS
jgi:hypothetical protein